MTQVLPEVRACVPERADVLLFLAYISQDGLARLHEDWGVGRSDARSTAMPGVVLMMSGVALVQVVGANEVIPVPAPSSEMSRWTDGPGRVRVELDVNGATLRGWAFRAGTAAVAQAEVRRSGLNGNGHRGNRSHGANGAGGLTNSTPNGDRAADRGVPVIVFFNGNLMTVDRSDELYRRLAGLGVEAVAYDYRGYGFSEGEPDVAAFRKDALAIYDRTVKAYSGRRVLVYGFSLGTAMAAYVASERAVDGVILAAPFATAEEEMPVFARRMGFAAEAIRSMVPGDDARVAFDEVGMMRRSVAPLLVMSGTADMLVPIAQGRMVAQASGAKVKRFVELRGAEHHETVFVEGAWRALGEFLRGI